MTSVTEPTTRTETTAMKDAQADAIPSGVALARGSDPATSHEAAKVATGSLRRRMADVLQTFQWRATECAKTPDDPFEGFTDEEMAMAFNRYGFVGSPSGIRTARKDLERAGLLEPRMIGDVEETRPTRLGNPAVVYVLTDAGAAFDLAGLR
jgi:hypothetical protein